MHCLHSNVEPGLCNRRLSVHLSDPSLLLLWVCCRVSCVQEISIDSGGRPAAIGTAAWCSAASADSAVLTAELTMLYTDLF